MRTPGCLLDWAAQQSNRPAVSASFSSRLEISSSNTPVLLIPCRNNFSAFFWVSTWNPSGSRRCCCDCEEVPKMRAMIHVHASQKMTDWETREESLVLGCVRSVTALGTECVRGANKTLCTYCNSKNFGAFHSVTAANQLTSVVGSRHGWVRLVAKVGCSCGIRQQ